MMLDQLAALAVAIRKSGAHARLQKADRNLDPSQHEALRDHLCAILLSQPTEMGNLTNPVNSNLLSTVQKRLIQANLQRRNRFLYAQRHSRRIGVIKISPETVGLMSGQSAVMDPKKPVEAPSEEPVSSKRLIDIARGPQTPHTVQTVTSTTASAVQGSIALSQKPKSSQGALTQVSSTGSRIVYPHPPTLKKGVSTFKCPCCCQSLPTMFAEGGRWKCVISVLEDIVKLWVHLANAVLIAENTSLRIYVRTHAFLRTAQVIRHSMSIARLGWNT